MRKALLIGLAVYLVIGLAVATILRDEQRYDCPSRAWGEMSYGSLDDVPRSVRDRCRPRVTLKDRITWFGLVTPLWPGLAGMVVLKLDNEVAMMKCMEIAMAQGEDEYGVEFQWLPTGWTCETKSGSRYLGFWLL